MHKAYELYLQEVDGRRRLHMYACDSTEQVMQKARDLLDEHGLESVEVRVDGVHLFSVTR
jgi:hypothetical protein